LAGYETAITVKKINEAKINVLQGFATKIDEQLNSYISENELNLTTAEQHNLNKCFFGEIYATKPKEFEFKLEECALICKIVAYIKRSLALNNNVYSIFSIINENIESDDDVVDTPIGCLFGINERLNIISCPINDKGKNQTQVTKSSARFFK
jgi:hypothetical protein